MGPRGSKRRRQSPCPSTAASQQAARKLKHLAPNGLVEWARRCLRPTLEAVPPPATPQVASAAVPQRLGGSCSKGLISKDQPSILLPPARLISPACLPPGCPCPARSVAPGVQPFFGEGGLVELLALPEVEAVFAVIPPQAMIETVKQCLAAGKHVLSEKASRLPGVRVGGWERVVVAVVVVRACVGRCGAVTCGAARRPLRMLAWRGWLHPSEPCCPAPSCTSSRQGPRSSRCASCCTSATCCPTRRCGVWRRTSGKWGGSE